MAPNFRSGRRSVVCRFLSLHVLIVMALQPKYQQLCAAVAAEAGRKLLNSFIPEDACVLHKSELVRILLWMDLSCMVSCFASLNKFYKVNNNLAFISTDLF